MPEEPQLHPEIRFTKATERCPNPERWHATDDQSTEIEVSRLIGSLVHALQPDYVIETGSFIGTTSMTIGTALHFNGQGHLDSIELDPEAARVARLNTDGMDTVTIHQMSSMDFTPREPIGFAWFDSLVSLRRAEFERFYPHMRPGTICGFHDTAPHHGDWSDFLKFHRGNANWIGHTHNVNVMHLPTPRGVTFLEVL